MSSARQTVSFLRNRLHEVGVEPDKRRGQNFLIDLNLIELLANSAQLQATDVVLEVGTGMGSLTGLIAPHVSHVVTVEIDAMLSEIAAEELENFSNITMLQQDALRNKNNIHATVLETVKEKLAMVDNGTFKLVANLPYNIATPLISNLLLWETTPSLMVVTIQKELANRIMAVPSTKDYSALSIWVQSCADVELIRDLSPSVFWPPPKVDSAIVRIALQSARRARIHDLSFFHTFVRSLFFHRRKYLRSVLASTFKRELTKSDVDQVLIGSPFTAEMRAEQLTVEKIQQLCELFRQKLVQKQAHPREIARTELEWSQAKTQFVCIWEASMFIEMTGKTLNGMMEEDELGVGNLSDVGVTDDTIVRVNRQGDIEVRKHDGWDIIGGLIGEFEARVKKATGLDWA